MPPEETILNADDPRQTPPAVRSDGEPPEPGAPADQAQTPPAAPAEFDYTRTVGANGELSADWRSGLPEPLRQEKCLDSIKTLQALAQGYVHAQHAIGSSKVAIPGENASAEEWNAFYKACGRPENMEGYSHEKISLPEGITLDDEKLKEFRKFAFDHGFSQKHFAAALEYDIARTAAAAAAADRAAGEEYQSTMRKLRAEHGALLPDYLAGCNAAMTRFGLAQVLSEHGLLNNYAVISALGAIGRSLGESKLHGDGAAPAVPGDPESRIAEIRNNPDDPFYRKEHPAHAARVAEMNRLLAAVARQKKKD